MTNRTPLNKILADALRGAKAESKKVEVSIQSRQCIGSPKKTNRPMAQ